MIYKSENFRSLKIASVLNRAVSKVLMQDIYLVDGHLVTVSKVEVSNDIRNATVFIVLPQNCSNKKDLIQTLNDSSYFIRKEIFSYVNLRYIPRLYFKLDHCFDNLVRVNQILESQ
ncbi:30S ribosome-binding factor RbfA [Ehrlichia muris]|uniref:Ribosome-binding factor A n=1 Tax=Ehrlichia muris AS145 TaxID=1423892 RepID=V9R658_9RICK|nr:30S ribosome-binding factor RbfA [Ehrlichia muris]AHC39252.1 ribosome-binding factor A [Ehrlichia muris AS145]